MIRNNVRHIVIIQHKQNVCIGKAYANHSAVSSIAFLALKFFCLFEVNALYPFSIFVCLLCSKFFIAGLFKYTLECFFPMPLASVLVSYKISEIPLDSIFINLHYAAVIENKISVIIIVFEFFRNIICIFKILKSGIL